MDLAISTQNLNDHTVVSVAGEVDVLTAPTLDEALSSVIGAGNTRLILDFGGVTFLDSTGLGVVVKALKRTREADGTLAVATQSERVLKVFRITGLDGIVPLYDNVAAALDAIGSSPSE